MPGQPHVHQPLHLAPGFHKLFHRKRSGVGISGIHIAARRVIIGEGPVYIIHIQIIQLQILQRAGAGDQHISIPVHIIPYLGGDEKLLPLHRSPGKGVGKNLSDLRLIAVAGRAVKGAVSRFDGPRHRLRNLLGGNVVGAKGTHAHRGHEGTCKKSSLGNLPRINFRHTFLSFRLL